jgi:hypothetical protein
MQTGRISGPFLLVGEIVAYRFSIVTFGSLISTVLRWRSQYR